ncbi:MAG: hypothetical protein Q8K22_07610 [Rhodoferax sp.]|jgi:hypothetical protein|nr:hypothetical protein [Rhodoferax sp.]
MEKQGIQKITRSAGQPVIHPYSALDPLPVPEAIESNTDAVWALWQDSMSSYDADQESDFESTMPADL